MTREVNDYRKEIRGILSVAQYSFTGEERCSMEKEICLPPASTMKVDEFLLTEKILRYRKSNFISLAFNTEDGLQARNTYFIGEISSIPRSPAWV